MSSRSLLIALAVLALAHTAEVRRPGSMCAWRLIRLLPHVPGPLFLCMGPLFLGARPGSRVTRPNRVHL